MFTLSLPIQVNLEGDMFLGVRHLVVELVDLDLQLFILTIVELQDTKIIRPKNGLPCIRPYKNYLIPPGSSCTERTTLYFTDGETPYPVAEFIIHEIHASAGIVIKDPLEVARFFFPDYLMPVETEFERREDNWFISGS